MPTSMKTWAEEIRTAEEALRTSLSAVPFARLEQVQVEPKDHPGEPDLLVRLSLPEGDITFVVEIRKSGQPRIAREAAGQLLRTIRVSSRAYGVFMAPYISPATMALCAEMDIGCMDFAGNCRLSFYPLFIERSGNPNPYVTRRELRSLYSPRASRVLRVLLQEPCRSWRMVELSREANVSLGMAASVKKMLADREWSKTEESGFVLSNPQALLDDWADNYSINDDEIVEFYSLDPVPIVEARMAEVCAERGIGYALTGFSGGARYAPAVRYERVTAYVESGDIESVAAALDLKKVSSGANLSLMVPYDEGVFYGSRDVEGQRVASAVQVYLDLTSLRGRGEEAAQAVLSGAIRPSWQSPT